jgi:D-glycero-D-manno-heptose 1,7-bisphosphate phosphatase
MSSPAVFFDRDGTLMEEVGYCGDAAQVRLIEGARESVRKLREQGFRIVIVTNQSGIGRGMYSEEDFRRVQAEFERQLVEEVDAVYFCADHPDVNRSRRKPSPDMLLEGARDLDLDLNSSYMVGDREGDVVAGLSAGCQSILVLSGVTQDPPRETRASAVAADVNEATQWILAHQLFQRSEVEVKTLERAGEGDFSVAWLVNGQHICRVPKHETARESLHREVAMMAEIAAQLPLTVPLPAWRDGFAMHDRVPGDPFTLEDYRQLDSQQRQSILREIAGFLRAMHSVKLANPASIPNANHRDFVGEPVLLHGDFSPDHILWDREKKSLTGIIDFGDLQYGDPAWDYVYFWDDYDEAMLRDLLTVSGDLEPGILERSRRFHELLESH